MTPSAAAGVQITELDIRDQAPFPLPGLDDLSRWFPFPTMREHQETALRAIIGALQAGYRTVVLEAPTGFGKSALAVALARWFEANQKRSYIIVSSKVLQDQYLQDFSTVTAKGRANFACLSRPQSCEVSQMQGNGTRCAHIPAPATKPDGKTFLGTSAKRGALYIPEDMGVCPYWEQKCTAMEHAFPLFNYDYFLHETRYAGDFGLRDLVVCDEAHAIETKLMKFVGFEISSHELEKAGAWVPKEELTAEAWISVLGDWRDRFDAKVKKAEANMENLTPLDLEKLEDFRHTVAKCNELMGELDQDPDLWVVSVAPTNYKGRAGSKVSFKPIRVQKWSSFLFSKGGAFVLQSATILDAAALCASLGVEGKVLSLKVPSIFPAERRAFLYRPVGKMSRASKDATMPLLLQELRAILAEHPTEKGVIHTHSYAIQKAVLEGVASPRFIANEGSASQDIFKQFKSSEQPLVLVTPSAYEGVDFKDDQCRWQVLCKVPYPDLGDPQVKKRADQDRAWYAWQTALRIVQTYGRGMRSPDDFCTTFILDEDFKRFYAGNGALFPTWFQEAVRWQK
ncbi:MAG: ATP-dependent DNA helicase [Candidatus Aenigmarchaeota archaeon]|nr:ATP-dependent DNA helicase [Candidatus Aenigmarchaeota archaeon]